MRFKITIEYEEYRLQECSNCFRSATFPHTIRKYELGNAASGYTFNYYVSLQCVFSSPITWKRSPFSGFQQSFQVLP